MFLIAFQKDLRSVTALWKADQLSTAHRLDPVLQQLDGELSQATNDEESERIAADIAGRCVGET